MRPDINLLNPAPSRRSHCVAVASDMGWTVKEALPVFAVPSNSYATGQTYTYTLCFRRGNYTFEALDSYGDGWTGGTFAISLAGALLASGTLESGFVQDFPFTGVDHMLCVL